MLCLPQDADQDLAKATYKHGVLSVTIPRKTLSGDAAKRIEVRAA
jgi:HSP20 family molecular chaperone IbpA